MMQIYYPSLEAIHQHTTQLDHAKCIHCNQTNQLVSHGFIYKKQTCAEPEAVGKRIFCSNRNHRTGCGRTIQLYLDSIVRYLHYAGACVVAFVLSLINGMTIARAYHQATNADTPRNAYRWLNKLAAQLSHYRSLLHQPLLQNIEPAIAATSQRRCLLASTFQTLLQRFGQPLCSRYQQQWQRSLL
jgi:hypothetical protein